MGACAETQRRRTERIARVSIGVDESIDVMQPPSHRPIYFGRYFTVVEVRGKCVDTGG